MKLVPPRALIAALAAVLSPCALAASAQAFAIEGVTATPVAPSRGGPLPPSGPFAAGAHPDMRIAVEFDGSGDGRADSVDELQIDLAPGIVANVRNADVCERFDPESTSRTDCGAETIVGEATTNATAYVPIGIPGVIELPGNIPVPLSGSIYRIPSPDPARYPTAFGIDVGPPAPLAPLVRRVKLVSPITVIPHNLGLRASISGIPDEASGLSVHVDSLVQTLYGFTPAGRSFFTNPTACIDAPITVSAVSHAGETTSGTASYRPTDCENVPFGASLTTAADPSTPDSTSAISFDVRPGAGTPERDNSHVRRTTVIAPPGVLLNAALAANLEACTDAGFAQSDTSVPANCPASSEVGTIDFTSPILGNFPGTVYFGTQTPTDRLRLFLDVPLFGAHIKVSATVNPDNATGQVTTVFSDLPQIAFTNFRLTFRGGARSALVTPTTCGENVSQAVVGPWSGGPAIRPTGSFTTAGDCVRLFAPSMGTLVANPQAGATTAFTLSFDRPDRTVPVGSVAFDLPPGLIGSLALRGLTKCSLTNAAAGNCEESSRIGSVQSIVGSGGEPPTLPGSIYLTEPKVPGDPAGLSVKVPARLGPVDAGTVIVGQRLALGADGGLDVVSDPIPALQFGIPLAIRRLIVTVDREGFMRNPTSCGERPAGGVFTPLDGGPGATANSSITVSGCERLPFAPRITGTISGRNATRRGVQPRFTTRITQRAGQAAMRTAVVTLPRALSTNLPTINASCRPEELEQDSCSRRSMVATATAVSPLIERPLRGPTYLVRVGTGLPKLVVQLRGEVSLDLEGIISISRAGTVITTFDRIPDLALSSFTLKFRGRQGALTTVGDLCRRPPLKAAFTGQNGKRASARPRLVVRGCTKATASLRFRGGRGNLSSKVTAPSGKRLRSVSLALPRGLRLAPATVVAKRGKKRLAGRAVRTRGRTVTLRLPRRGAPRTVSMTLRGVTARGGLARRLARRRGPLTVTVKTRQTDGARASLKVRAKLR
ncbi:hypothetical protein [Conexibacter arvalis]|uniref:Uncharacterized protein n=1 Tax=Conexibacter arvalis TaxID=912552 RepID=A0A840IA45_9ACTN|nr:hypothetical protein [Conexibacter arvalis]MBB4661482.1 hypothetical protein [Conexibacter arvalis]